MKKLRLWILLSSLFISHNIWAEHSFDTGQVARIYATPQGAIALKLNGGFPNAIKTDQCPINNGWAGLNTSEPVLQSVIIAAKSSGQPLTVSIKGCEGKWFKIREIYMN